MGYPRIASGVAGGDWNRVKKKSNDFQDACDAAQAQAASGHSATSTNGKNNKNDYFKWFLGMISIAGLAEGFRRTIGGAKTGAVQGSHRSKILVMVRFWGGAICFLAAIALMMPWLLSTVH